jgi:hypothetical protein
MIWHGSNDLDASNKPLYAKFSKGREEGAVAQFFVVETYGICQTVKGREKTY